MYIKYIKNLHYDSVTGLDRTQIWSFPVKFVDFSFVCFKNPHLHKINSLINNCLCMTRKQHSLKVSVKRLWGDLLPMVWLLFFWRPLLSGPLSYTLWEVSGPTAVKNAEFKIFMDNIQCREKLRQSFLQVYYRLLYINVLFCQICPYNLYIE